MNRNKTRNMMRNVWKNSKGPDLIEYALAAGMVVVTAVAAMPALSTAVNNLFSHISLIVTANAH